MIIRSVEDCYARYGRLGVDPAGGLLWKEAPNWIRPFQVPGQIVMRNQLGKLVYRIYCNTDIHIPLANAFANLINCGAHLELVEFNGAFNVRWVRGMPGVPSFHSWGIALDFNASKNPLGKDGVWSSAFINSMESAGFSWGGRFKRKDPMHFDIVRYDKIQKGV